MEGIYMENLTIDKIQEFVNHNNIKWTEHCSFRMFERMITRDDVIKALLTGNIIEYYPDDYPYPSCLVLGYTEKNTSLHVVCGIGKEYLYIITTYSPDETKWVNNSKRRN